MDRFLWALPLLDQNQDQGGAKTPPTPPPTPPTPPTDPNAPPADDASQDDAQEPDADGEEGERSKDARNQSASGKKYSEREMRNAVQREVKARETALRESIKAELVSEQELDAARASGELSKVIDNLQKKLADLEPLKSEVEEWRRLAESRYQTSFEGLPDSIKLFAPDDQASNLEKERWLVERALPAVTKLGVGDPVKGLSAKDDPAKKQRKTEDDLAQIRNGFVSTGEYRPM